MDGMDDVTADAPWMALIGGRSGRGKSLNKSINAKEIHTLPLSVRDRDKEDGDAVDPRLTTQYE